MYTNQNQIQNIQQKLIAIARDKLSPIACSYGYSETPLEANLRWRPIVLFLGNYSSGKSTFINELLGADIQQTSQAPTDDNFTVLALAEQDLGSDDRVRLLDRREGKSVLYDERYPFENLRRHGDRFAAHFRMLHVNSPILQNLSLIDTPGMLDSSSHASRGYDYQEVIADFARMADLVIVMFDAHKAGTIHETHDSLQRTLPAAVLEDRVLYVLNRVDECQNLNDLLRVYGTLCWNLAQMTMRKDIPPIFITYSQKKSEQAKLSNFGPVLQLLNNQRDEIHSRVFLAPRYRLDHIVGFVENHSTRLSVFVEALVNYGIQRRKFVMKYFASVLGLGSGLAGIAWLFTLNVDLFRNAGDIGASIVAAFVFFIIVIVGHGLRGSFFMPHFHRRQYRQLDTLVMINNQNRQENWIGIKKQLQDFLRLHKGEFSLKQAKLDQKSLLDDVKLEINDIRQSLNNGNGQKSTVMD